MGGEERDEPTRVALVGELAVTRNGRAFVGADIGSRKSRRLLAYLAVNRDHTVDVDSIAAALWAGAPPERYAENVASLVSRLRKTIGPELVVGGRHGYRLGSAPAVTVDVDEAARWVLEAERRHAAAEPGVALAAAARAEELLAADGLLVDEPDADWVESARADHHALTVRLGRVLAAAALAAGDSASAARRAAALLDADPYDETAARVLMQAHAAAGEPARALKVYAALRARLADELGCDPSPETEEMYVAILRSQQPAAATTAAVAPQETVGLVGRAAEMRRLRAAWNDAAAGRPRVTLVTGEAGIGKTRLVEELHEVVASTGGAVLAARCYEAERSLFLQPVVDAIDAYVRGVAPAAAAALAGDYAYAIGELVPAYADVVRAPRRRGTPELEQRRAFDALVSLLRAIAAERPLLLSFDDLHNAGRTTVEFLHYLGRRTRGDRMLAIASLRSGEGADVVGLLEPVADVLALGPLPSDAVAALAAAAGVPDRADDLVRRTGGHALYVVESLRALRANDAGVPASLQAAVIDRVQRAGRAVETALRAASVLGAAFTPDLLAALTALPVASVAATCADAQATRLLVIAGREYEFAHDLVREVLYATTPEPVRVAWHQRAADLLVDSPEVLATHAAAAGDKERAARAWLRAGEQALLRAASADAQQLSTQSLAALPDGLPELRARALLLRGRARAAQTDYRGAMDDFTAAGEAARAAGDVRLEILVLRELGGEVPTGMAGDVGAAVSHLRRGLVLAASLGDRQLQADLLAWTAVLATNNLQFAEAVGHGIAAVEVARAAGDDESLAAALDGRKTSLAYLGEVGEMAPVLDELMPLLQRQGDLFRLQWATFESSFAAMAAGEFAAAEERIRLALEIQRRSGYVAYAGWYVAHLAWIARLRGDVSAAVELGRQALELCRAAPHVWCTAIAAAHLGVALAEAGEPRAAVVVLDEARAAAEQDGAAAYRLRCLAPLAEVTGSAEILDEAQSLLDAITAPPGSAFVLGDWCYTAVARAWLARGEPERAAAVLAPLRAAVERIPWVVPLATVRELQARVDAAVAVRSR